MSNREEKAFKTFEEQIEGLKRKTLNSKMRDLHLIF